ncbi:MAG TPA: Hsp33 family molecular chaperone HslO [Alphaproteobacteria bacterium]|nr:Hsp33 family molecular chaperone HslO [Alphaproteobacteria bacterium]
MSKISGLNQDLVQPFQLESSQLRGRLVRLGPALDIILHQHAYPDAVASLLSEAMVIAAALSTSLKYDGVFTLQAKGDGPVRLLVADVTSDGGIRAYAQFDKDGVKNAVPDTKLIGKNAYLAFTVDQKRKEDRYQGIVELSGGTLAEAVQHYFRQSEQLPTGIVTAIDRDAQGRWHGGCLMLQKMPREGGIAYESETTVEDDWHRAMMLMGTCTPAELTDTALEPNELLYRLFHEEGVRVFDPHHFRHECRCSEERVVSMLQSLPRAEVETLAVDGMVEVTCEFCNKSYRFDEKRRDVLYGKNAD